MKYIQYNMKNGLITKVSVKSSVEQTVLEMASDMANANEYEVIEVEDVETLSEVDILNKKLDVCMLALTQLASITMPGGI